MRTELRPLEVPVTPGEVTIIEIDVANNADVIDGVTARVEGLDPSWVHLPLPVLSLFPESTGVLPIHVRFPTTTVVGDYLVVVHVESTIDPLRRSTHDLWLHVEAVEAATMRLRPSIVTKGKKATFTAIVSNAGNIETAFTMAALDDTRVLECRAEPMTLIVPPGQDAAGEVFVRGPRPWFGQPVTRTIVVSAQSQLTELRELATFNQKPRIPRGLLTLAILGSIVALWSTVFLLGADLLRDDPPPTKAVGENFQTGGVEEIPKEAIAGSMLGKVTAESTGEGLERITVEAYRVVPEGASELTGSAGTAEDGTYSLASLLPGTYRLRFTAEGYKELWYPAATSEADAAEVPLEPTEERTDLNVALTGGRGALVGTVLLPDSAEPDQLITVTLTQVVEQAESEAAAGFTSQPNPPEPIPPQQTTGKVSFEGLVTPATYRIRIEAEGFEPQAFEETLAGGETRVLNTVRLSAAAGSIAGTVLSSTGEPLGNVVVTAKSGEFEKEAKTPTAGNVGQFLLDGLETPRTYVLTFARGGFSSQTIALDLGAGENRTGVDATLTGGTGTISGSVDDVDDNPLGGVEVTVTRGEFVASTATLTTTGPGAGVGSYSVADIPTPGTYAVTFAAPGFVSETRQVVFLDPGLQSGVSATLSPANATISGTARDPDGPADGVTVELSDGETVRTTITASTPPGGYSFHDVPPGSYTLTFSGQGVKTYVALVTVGAGDALPKDVELEEAG